MIARLNHRFLNSTCLTAALIVAIAKSGYANPVDGQVVSGSATITESGKKLDVVQSTDRAVIDWRGFDIAPDEHTQFTQPNSSSVALNRINSVNPTNIAGKLTANGNVILINPNGVFFSKTATVDVNGLIATTADIDNQKFMNGSMVFDKPRNPNAAVVNEGSITAKEAGLVGLVAPNVANSGVITAKLGRVHLASGDTMTVDLYGDGLLEVKASDALTSQVVQNTGTIHAEGGTIALTAAAGRQTVNSVVKVSGELLAPSVGVKNGKIIIAAVGSHAVAGNVTADKGKKTGSSTVLMGNAVLDVSGRKSGEKGGSITVTGDHVNVASSILTASGHSSGGTVLIGGDIHGEGSTPTAQTLSVENVTSITADALMQGNGGKIILWSDDATTFAGSISARGGVTDGLGGFVETSGHNTLSITGGTVDLTDAYGNAGTWLLDPTDITINNHATTGDGTNTFSSTQIESMSASANVALNATNNITFNIGGETLNLSTASRNLTLTAGNQITTASAGAITTNGGAINLNATNGILLSNPFTFTTNGGALSFNNALTNTAAQTIATGTGTLTFANTVNGAGALTASAGALSFNGAWGGTTALGNVSLTSANTNFTLPNLTSTGNVTLNAGTGTITTGTIATGAGNLTLTSDDVAIGGALSGTGTLTLQPSTLTRAMQVGYGSGTWNLIAAEIARLTDGWSQINIGRTDGTGGIDIGTASFTDPVTFLNAYRSQIIYGLTGTGNAAFTFNGNTGGYANIFGNITTANQPVYFSRATNIDTGTLSSTGGNITFNGGVSLTNDALAVTIDTGGGALAFNASLGRAMGGPTKVLTLTSGAGSTTFTGAVAGQALDIVSTAGSYIISSAWGYTNNVLGNVSLTSSNTSFTMPNLVTTGNVSLSAGTGTITTGSIATGAGNLTLTADDLAIGGNLSGTGTLTLQPSGTNRVVCINYTSGACGSANLGLSTAEVGKFVDGWSQINIGRLDSTADMYAGAITFTDPVSLLSANNFYVNGTLTGTGNSSITVASQFGSNITHLFNNIVTAGGAVTTNLIHSLGGNIITNGGAALFGLAVDSPIMVSTSGGAITNYTQYEWVPNSGVGDTVTFNSNSGATSFNNVEGKQNITANAGSFTFNNAWGTSVSLGTVSLTSSSGLTLPSITASSIFARTTGAASDITLASGKVLTATGAGNALTLAAGRNFINNAGSGALALTGSGRWLVYSANPTDTTGEETLGATFNRYSCAYSGVGTCAASTTLGTTIAITGIGNGLLYSYTPTLTATPTTQTIVYGNATPTLSAYGYNISGYNTGEGSDTVTGSLNGTTNYSQGSDIGNYAINYTSGALSSALGYAVNYANSATALAVGKRTLTVGLSGMVSKEYDGTNLATLSAGNYSLSNFYNTDASTVSVANTSGTYNDKTAASNKNVSVSGLTLTGTKSGNYQLSTNSLTSTIGTITQKALSLIGLSGTNKVYDTTTTAALAGTASLSGVVSGDTVGIGTTGTGTFADKNVGNTKAITVLGYSISGADANNYSFTQPAGLTADITKATLNVAATGINKVYNTLTSGTIILSDNHLGSDSLNLSYGTATYDDKNVGTGKTLSVAGINVTGTDANNYTFNTMASTTANITKAALTVAATGINKVYDTLTSGTVTLSDNHLGSDSLSLNYGSASYADKNAANSKALSVSSINVTGTDAGNYTFNTTASTTANITKAALTVAATGINKVYDALTSGTVTLSDNHLGSDSLNLSYGSASYADKNAANGKLISVSGINVTGTDSGNYTFNTSANTNADITQASLTAAAGDQAIIYGTSVPTTSISYTGFVTGENSSVLGTVPTLHSAQTAIAGAGSYTGNYTLSGGLDTNYSFTYINGNLTVAKKNLNITADTQAVTYGTAPTPSAVTYSGFITGENATSLITAPIVSSALSGVQNVGTYTGNYTPSGAASNNYDFTYISGNLVVTKKNLNISADNQSVTYGTAAPAGSLTYNGFITGEDASFLSALPTVASVHTGLLNAGTYTGNYTTSGAASNNYSFSYSPGTLTVNEAALNVTANNRAITYGDAIPTTTVTYTGFVNGDNETVLTSLANVSSANSGLLNAGTYAGNYTASGAAANNYVFNYINGDLTVAKKDLNVIAGNRTQTYGIPVGSSTVSYNGFITGENVGNLITAPTVTSALGSIISVGTYAGNYVPTGGVSNNYSFHYINGNLTVTKVQLIATADTQTITYGTSVPTGSVSYSGFVNGEDASVIDTQASVASANNGIKNAGYYAGNYTAFGASDNNYSFTYAAGSLAINKALLLVGATNQSIRAGEIVPLGTITYAGFVNGENSMVLDIQPNLNSAHVGSALSGRYLNNYTIAGGYDHNYNFSYGSADLTVGISNIPTSVDYASQRPINVFFNTDNFNPHIFTYALTTDKTSDTAPNDSETTKSDTARKVSSDPYQRNFNGQSHIVIEISPDLAKMLNMTSSDAFQSL